MNSWKVKVKMRGEGQYSVGVVISLEFTLKAREVRQVDYCTIDADGVEMEFEEIQSIRKM